MKIIKTSKDILIAASLVILFTAIDQWTKWLAVRLLKGKAPVVLIPEILELRYVENRGAAFGILQQQQRLFFLLTAAAILLICLAYLFRIPSGKTWFPVNLICILILAGAVGNLIDRVRQSYVVDFIYFKLIDFPVFNAADCFITASAVLLGVLLIFPYKDLDWNRVL